MKRMMRWMAIGISLVVMSGALASADSFGVYFGSDGWGFNMNFGDYDYYNRYSPGYYSNASFDFRAALSPYGSWYYIPEFGGNVWIPDVPAGWRPYTYGSWSYTSYGWFWTAYEPWGWIPHHYGNWFFHPAYNWIWIPGYTWAPAHVTWGVFNGYYGWAPLPPRHCAYYSSYRHDYRQRYHSSHHWYSQHRHPDHGYRGSAGYQDDDGFYEFIPNDAWVIVSSNQFMNDNVFDVALSPEQNPSMFQNRSFRLNQVAPEKRMIERETRQSIPVTRMDEVSKQVDGKTVKVVTPRKIESGRVKKLSTVNQSFRPVNQRNTSGQITETGKPAPQKPVRSNEIKRPGKQTDVKQPAKQTVRPENKTSPIQPARTSTGKETVRPAKPATVQSGNRENIGNRNGNGKNVRPDTMMKNGNQNRNTKQMKPAGKGTGGQAEGKALESGSKGNKGKQGAKGVRPVETPKSDTDTPDAEKGKGLQKK